MKGRLSHEKGLVLVLAASRGTGEACLEGRPVEYFGVHQRGLPNAVRRHTY